MRVSGFANPQFFGLFLLEFQRRFFSRQFNGQGILPPGIDLRDHQRADGSGCHLHNQGSSIFGVHCHRTAVGVGYGTRRVQANNLFSCNEFQQVHQMRTDVRESPGWSAQDWFNTPVVVTDSMHPVLQVLSAHGEQAAKLSFLDVGSGLPHHGMESVDKGH